MFSFSTMEEERWVLALPNIKTPNSNHQIPLFLFVLLFLLLTPPSLSINGYNQTETDLLHPKDRIALVLFKSQVQDPYQFLFSWVGSNCSNWTGVTCSNRTGRVISINLTGMNLSGPVHPSLCKLLLLETLILPNNSFYGSVPLCLCKLMNLKTLEFGHNMGLNGTVPPCIGNFSKTLERIDLGFNSFIGEIPESLYELKSLKYLDLSHNSLEGNLGEFRQSLVYLNLESNSISGTLPCLMASVESIWVLNLASNSIVGGIPSCISSLRELRQLNLSFNGLS